MLILMLSMHSYRTLKPGFSSMLLIDTNLFQLGSTNPKKKSQTLSFLVGGEANQILSLEKPQICYQFDHISNLI